MLAARRKDLRLLLGSALAALFQGFDNRVSTGRSAVKVNGEILVPSSDVNVADSRGTFEGSAHGRDTSASNILAKFELGGRHRCIGVGSCRRRSATVVGCPRRSATVAGGFRRATNQEEGACARSDQSNHDYLVMLREPAKHPRVTED